MKNRFLLWAAAAANKPDCLGVDLKFIYKPTELARHQMRPDRNGLRAEHKSSDRGCECHHPEDLLRWQDLTTTGGEYSEAYCLNNLFEDTGDCYCSSSGQQKRGVNVICRCNEGSCTITALHIRAPRTGFSCPIRRGVVFVCWEKPDLEEIEAYDDVLSKPDFAQLAACARPGQPEPAAYFDLGDNSSLCIPLDIPRSAEWVVIKFLATGEADSPDNIDAEFFGLMGFTGPYCSSYGELMM